MTKPFALLFLCFFFIPKLQAQVPESAELFKTLKTKDSLLFTIGFNTCDIRQFETLVSENFEFYHDKAGFTSSKQAFISGIKDGICKMDYKPRRELAEGSLAVYRLEKDGVVYGAIQTGTHRFYAIEKDKPEYLTSIAKFTHIWLIEEGLWKLSRAISYDHQETDKNASHNE